MKIVYDLRHSIIYFRTRNNPLIRVIHFDAFSFSCLTPVKVLHTKEKVSGDVTYAFIDYTWRTNRRMFQIATQKVPYKWEVTEA